MNLQCILQQLDQLLHECRLEEAGEYLRGQIAEAKAKNAIEVQISLLNELIGFCRDCGLFEEALSRCQELLNVLQQAGIETGPAYGTSLLNIANAYRAAGRLAEAEHCFRQVKLCYDGYLQPDDMLYASLYNNLSLLYQEQMRFEEACEVQYQALQLIEGKDEIKTGISKTNLGVSLLHLQQRDQAKQYLTEALKILGGHTPSDFHYSAALAGMGDVLAAEQSFDSAAAYYEMALSEIELHMGKNNFYDIVEENLLHAYQMAYPVLAAEGDLSAEKQFVENVESPQQQQLLYQYRLHVLSQDVTVCQDSFLENSGFHGIGLSLARRFYMAFGQPMLHRSFSEYEHRIAAGLCGEGSECFGYDDSFSCDHDFGPGFCLWVTSEVYEQIGDRLQAAYELLPKNFMGYQRLEMKQAAGRIGVCRISDYWIRLLGLPQPPREKSQWLSVEEAMLAAAVNGQVFTDPEGIFTEERKGLRKGYPQSVWFLRLAQQLALMAQSGQYNYGRMTKRKETVAAFLALSEFAKSSMRAVHLLNRTYAPYEKWLHRSTSELPVLSQVAALLNGLFCNGEVIEQICELIREELLRQMIQFQQQVPLEEGFVLNPAEAYLGAYAEWLAQKGKCMEEKELMVNQIVLLEWNAFDQVQNEGGRANCQDDWDTFSIMRKSQYDTWPMELLRSYCDDLEQADKRGWNMMTEKYGRMMKTTAPEAYEKIADQFPVLSEKRLALQEAIIAIQVGWMEELAQQYPVFAGQARPVHTAEDTSVMTSYETYLRGEISTYSERTLQLYGGFIATVAKEGGNLAERIMTNTANAYGYASIEAAEAAM